MSDTPEDTPPEPTGAVDESSLAPVTRDRRFIARLVLLGLVAALASSFIGMKLRSAAGSCGASLIRPGSTVIPVEGQSNRRTP